MLREPGVPQKQPLAGAGKGLLAWCLLISPVVFSSPSGAWFWTDDIEDHEEDDDEDFLAEVAEEENEPPGLWSAAYGVGRCAWDLGP